MLITVEFDNRKKMLVVSALEAYAEEAIERGEQELAKVLEELSEEIDEWECE